MIEIRFSNYDSLLQHLKDFNIFTMNFFIKAILSTTNKLINIATLYKEI